MIIYDSSIEIQHDYWDFTIKIYNMIIWDSTIKIYNMIIYDSIIKI